MKVLVFGSLNIDKVYSLDKLPEKGETLYCSDYEIHVGGKGLNQALSFAKAGADVFMAGKIGNDGEFLVNYLNKNKVNTDLIEFSDSFTGHAIIEVDKNGQNQMILFSGANSEITSDYCDLILGKFNPGDLILMQCETSQTEYMINAAHERGLKVALNPSPFTEKIKKLPFECIDFLILNESEGQSITSKNKNDEVIAELLRMLDDGDVILTLGGDGAIFADNNESVFVPAFKVNAVDTTGAGDTFTGYSLYSYLIGCSKTESLEIASAASAIAVTKSGAAETIPDRNSVESFLNRYKK